MGMRVDGPEVELACQQEDHRYGSAQPGVSAGLSFGGLKQPIQGLQEAVSLAALNPGWNAIKMTADHAGHGLQSCSATSQSYKSARLTASSGLCSDSQSSIGSAQPAALWR